MANIILPQAKVLDTISDNATMLVEENGEIRRYNVTSLTEDFVSQVDNKPKAGFIYPLASATVPNGFLLCDGSEYNRTEYSELFAAIGTIYGSGDGSTTFNVPNLATRVPVGTGSGYTLGSTGGEVTHTLTVDEMPNHNHRTTAGGGAGNIYYASGGTGIWLQSSSNPETYSDWTGTRGGSKAHNNMQPYTVVNYIIATGKNTGVSVQDIITGAQALPLGVEYGGTGATNAATALENLGGISKELLWENANPTSTFSERDITLIENDATEYEVHMHMASNNYYSVWRVKVGRYVAASQVFEDGGVGKGNWIMAARHFKMLSNTKIHFYNAYYSLSTSFTTYIPANGWCVPLAVYGIKGVS